MKRILLLLLTTIFLFLSGCASYLVQINKENNHIVLPGVAFNAPDTGEWYVQYLGLWKQQAVIYKHLGPSEVKMIVFKVDKLDPEMRSKSSAKEAADCYRNREKQTMINLGVNTGQYTIKDLVMGEVKIGDKLFYTMDYTNVANNCRPICKARASLYLYFPSSGQNDFFILTHFQEATPMDAEIPDHKPIFLDLLKSMSLTN